MPSPSAGAPRWRPTAPSIAPPWRSGPSRRRTSARGSRACCGRWWARASRSGAPRSPRSTRRPRAAVVETPLLFEAGLEGGYDATIAVVADEDVRAERAAARGHHAVDERSARQLSQEEKAARATYVVANSGTVEQLELALAAVLEKLDAAVADRT